MFSLKIIFMGSPEFAVPSLEALHASMHDVLAVVTVPDKPKGRGLALSMSDVKKKALELGLPLLQPKKLKDADLIAQLKEFNADIFVVVAFRILPPEIYEMPTFGAVNAHASLLPKYRGAAPIHWAVYHGEKETGVTVFQIDKKVDTGRMILQSKTAIGEDETTGELYDRLMYIAADALVTALDQLDSHHIEYMPQNNDEASMAPKVHPDTGKLDFSMGGEALCRAVRAFNPWPGAFTFIHDQRIKISKASFVLHPDTEPGKIAILNKKQFAIHCKDGYFLPMELQSPGRKKMSVVDWLNGNNL